MAYDQKKINSKQKKQKDLGVTYELSKKDEEIEVQIDFEGLEY